MGNFLTQAGSDFWNILRKKLPESFGMEWGVPEVPDMAKPVNMARSALNAYASMPTFSNEAISKGIQGRVAMSGIGPKPEWNPAGSAPVKTAGDLVANADAATTGPAVNPPITIKNPIREAINNSLTESGGGSWPGSLPAPQPDKVIQGNDVFSRNLHGNSPIEKLSMGTDTFWRSKSPSGTTVITGRGTGGAAGGAPGSTDLTVSGLGPDREALVAKLREMIGNPKYMVGAVTGGVSALNALTNAETGQQNAAIAGEKLAQPIPITGYEGEQHAVDLLFPETGERAEFFRGILPKEGDDTMGKLSRDARLERYKAVAKKAYGDTLNLDPEETKAARNELEAMDSELRGVKKTGKPTWEQFAEAAKKAGSKLTLEQLKQAYKERYGS